MQNDELLEKIAKAFGYPVKDVAEAFLCSYDKSIDSIIKYCESKKEKVHGKEETKGDE